MSPTLPDDKNSFNLTSENRQRNDQLKGDNSNQFTWQEHAYERLKVLYGVGRILASADDIRKTFPEILTLCEATFPFLTAILIEKRGELLNTIVWNTENATQQKINAAINNANEFFTYLTNVSPLKSDALRMNNILSSQLDGVHTKERVQKETNKNYCVIPLVVDQLPAFGILQLEGSLRLNEKDLEFIGALADLIAISVDRYHKTKLEKELRIREAQISSSKLSLSQTHVLELETERELRESFVSLLTHDLRTPLTAIKMVAQLIERHKENSATVRSYAQRINKSAERADKMISDLLDANRISSGEKLPLNIELVDLPALVTRTLAELTAIHGERFTLNADESIKGYWDSSGLRRIVENLCNNAIKYGSSDGMVIVAVYKKKMNVIIEVKNIGNVISHEDQKLLFQQFHRGEKTAVKGWGIGLTLVRGIAEAHGGTVEVKSEIETGTVFTVSIPI